MSPAARPREGRRPFEVFEHDGEGMWTGDRLRVLTPSDCGMRASPVYVATLVVEHVNDDVAGTIELDAAQAMALAHQLQGLAARGNVVPSEADWREQFEERP